MRRESNPGLARATITQRTQKAGTHPAVHLAVGFAAVARGNPSHVCSTLAGCPALSVPICVSGAHEDRTHALGLGGRERPAERTICAKLPVSPSCPSGWPRDRTGRSGGVSSAVQSSHPMRHHLPRHKYAAIGPRRWLIQRATRQQPNQPAPDVNTSISFLSRSISAACSKHNFIVLTINSYSMFPLALNTYMLGFCML